MLSRQLASISYRLVAKTMAESSGSLHAIVASRIPGCNNSVRNQNTENGRDS